MFSFSKLFVMLAVATYATNAFKVDKKNETASVTNTANISAFTQLRVQESNSTDTVYTYKCTFGTYNPNRLICTVNNSHSWNTPKNLNLNLRCPGIGSGLPISYADITYSVTSSLANCYIYEGAIGLGYMGVTISAWNTLLFNYSANFYTY